MTASLRALRDNAPWVALVLLGACGGVDAGDSGEPRCSQLRGIQGSGLRAIQGSGLPSTQGTSLQGIEGSGLQNAEQRRCDGAQGIQGSGLHGIQGTGVEQSADGVREGVADDADSADFSSAR
jgi:hypothetical protein